MKIRTFGRCDPFLDASFDKTSLRKFCPATNGIRTHSRLGILVFMVSDMCGIFSSIFSITARRKVLVNK